MSCRCVMTLVRGFGSKFPCPVCLVPPHMLADLSETHPRRTTRSMQAVLKEANEKHLASEKENVLKEAGLRGVDVCYQYCAVYST